MGSTLRFIAHKFRVAENPHIEKSTAPDYSLGKTFPRTPNLAGGGNIPNVKCCGRLCTCLFLSLLISSFAYSQDSDSSKLSVNWNKTVRVSKTTATLQVVVNPPLRHGTPVHDNAFRALNELHADFVRYVPWLPYPRLAVAELDPPGNSKTSWDFSVIDPMTIDFLEATKGHPTVLNFSTIPQWMYKTEKPVTYPADPNQVTWNYEQGTELRDPSGREVADYYARLLAWYTKGGFTDELGKKYESGYHYSIPYWEVLNEVDFEHQTSPEAYTTLYDAIVTAMHGVEPTTKFVGLALGAPSQSPRFFEYFLEHNNHKPDVPLDFISYHFYATPNASETPDTEQYTFFAQADGFLHVVRYIEAIRQRLSPETGTMVNEIGAISANDSDQGQPGHVEKPIPSSYWHLTGALYAYIFGHLSELGIDAAGESQLVGYPTQYPSVSMVDWQTGKPNPRFWVLRLLKDNFGPGDKLVETNFSSADVYALPAVTRSGKHRLLLVNKRERATIVDIPGAASAQMEFVDMTTDSQPSSTTKLSSDKVNLGGYSVAVVTFP